MEQYKVLIVEDDDAARQQLAKVVRKEGFEVVVADNGRVGLEMFQNESPEIIITDLKMPDVDGLEVMHTARRLSTNVQTILITAFGETDTAVTALREGALDYLKKPLDLDLLTVALGRARKNIAENKKTVSFPTVLLAEDDETSRKPLARMLEKEGCKVVEVADGEEAMNVFQQTKIDIAILDIKMPKKDGLQALHEMRSITDDFGAIILTGYGDESSAIQALRDGATSFLKKPLSLDEMIISVEKAIEKLEAERSLKYRTRELELAKEIIARITADKQIVIDTRDHTQKPARDFALNLLDAVPVGLVVLDKDMTIQYMNRYLAGAIGYEAQRVDQGLVERLRNIGMNELSYESLVSAVKKVFASPAGTLERVSIGKYTCLTLTTMTILRKQREENVVLMAMRGERI